MRKRKKTLRPAVYQLLKSWIEPATSSLGNWIAIGNKHRVHGDLSGYSRSATSIVRSPPRRGATAPGHRHLSTPFEAKGVYFTKRLSASVSKNLRRGVHPKARRTIRRW